MTIMRLVLQGALYGQITNNVIHIAKDGPVTDQQMQAIMVHHRDNFIQQVRGQQTASFRWTGMQIYNAEIPSNIPLSLLVDITGTETSVQTQAAPFACYLIRFRTAVAGPKGRGRIYLPGVPPFKYTNGLATQATINTWQTIFNTIGPMYIGNSTSSGFAWCVAPRNAPTQNKTIVSLELGLTMGIQRRRNIGVGV